MAEPQSECCGTCRFWLSPEPADFDETETPHGDCRRRSPQHMECTLTDRTAANINGQYVRVWPQTFGYDWCGEHEPAD